MPLSVTAGAGDKRAEQESPLLSHWKRNLVVLCIVQTFTMVAFSSYNPLIPYYIQELGASSPAQATSWAAFYNTGAALAMMIAAPIWGSLSDRYGRKLMLARASLAGALTMSALYLVRSPAQLVAVRIVQGFLSGTVTAATTLVATETPEQHLGASLGMLLTIQSAARAVGPLVGGVAADALGLRALFPFSAASAFVAFLGGVFLIREQNPARTSPSHKLSVGPSREMLGTMLSRNILVLLVVRGAIGLGLSVLAPVLSLYIKSLSPDSQSIATLAGAVASAAALTSSISALVMGRMGDKIGPKPVLVVCGLGVALTLVPQALARSSTQLLGWQAVQGIFLGGITPTAVALLVRATHPSRRGTVLGIASGARAGGRALGPLVGAGCANAWGMGSAFQVTAGVYGLMSVMVAALVRPQTEPVPIRADKAAAPVASGSETAGDPPSPCS